jgi:glycosyltransferase involved in cell wall biosynthesis
VADAGGRRGRLPRVLFAVGSLDPGGSENQLFGLICRGHGVHFQAILMTFQGTSETGREATLERLGVERVRLDRVRGPRALRPLVAGPRAARYVRRLAPDVIYPWLEPSATTLAPAAIATGIPLIVGRRNISGANAERVPPLRWAVRRLERVATLVTANSQAVMDEAIARGIRPGRLRLVPNGHPVLGPLPPPPQTPVVIGYVANFRYEKGHGRLLAALETLPRDGSWRVDLAGHGPLEDSVRVDIERRGLQRHVRLVGRIAGAREFWAGRHVAALLSDHEGSPNALIEAALCGRPLLGTDVGGTPEIVTAETGLLVPPGDPSAIASALRRLIDDAALRERLGAGACELAASRYDIDASVRAHTAVIEEALGRAPRRRRRAPDFAGSARTRRS